MEAGMNKRPWVRGMESEIRKRDARTRIETLNSVLIAIADIHKRSSATPGEGPGLWLEMIEWVEGELLKQQQIAEREAGYPGLGAEGV